MINFKANYISDAVIKRRTPDNTFKDYNVSFIEFNSANPRDVFAIKDVAGQWGCGETFARSIFNDIQEEYYAGKKSSQYFAITKQRKSFETLLPDEILALAELKNTYDKRKELLFLQVNPEENMFAGEAVYKRIGTAILNSLKTLFNDKEIILKPVESAINFYKANQFVPLEFTSKLIWRPKL